MLVFDATPLIYLSKTESLRYLDELDDENIIPASVHREVVLKGKERGHEDALRIEKLIEEGTFEVQDVEEGEIHATVGEGIDLSRADLDVLELARKEGCTAVMDESYGRDIADIQGIETRGTIWLVFRFLENGIVFKDEAKGLVDSMIDEGWYCSTDLYKDIIKKIEG